MSVSQNTQDYPCQISIPVRWGDMDSFGHVNNIMYLRYFESARIQYFEQIGMSRDLKDTGPILAETHCRYRAPVTYPDDVIVYVRVSETYEFGFIQHYLAFSQHLQSVCAEGSGRIVYYDYQQAKKIPLPHPIVEQLHKLQPDLAK